MARKMQAIITLRQPYAGGSGIFSHAVFRPVQHHDFTLVYHQGRVKDILHFPVDLFLAYGTEKGSGSGRQYRINSIGLYEGQHSPVTGIRRCGAGARKQY